jgi:hypothetical protein
MCIYNVCALGSESRWKFRVRLCSVCVCSTTMLLFSLFPSFLFNFFIFIFFFYLSFLFLPSSCSRSFSVGTSTHYIVVRTHAQAHAHTFFLRSHIPRRIRCTHVMCYATVYTNISAVISQIRLPKNVFDLYFRTRTNKRVFKMLVDHDEIVNCLLFEFVI